VIDKVKKIISYYDSVDGKSKKTELGRFVTVDLSALNLAISDLLSDSIIDRKKIFVDAGSGDGRVNLLISAGYGIPSLGIECDLELHKSACNHLSEFPKRYSSLIRLAHGDFSDDLVYNSENVPFERVGTFFNYINNPQIIAEKIAKQSPTGTKFLFWGAHHTYNFDKLNNLFSLKITTREEGVSSDILTKYSKQDYHPSISYFHIYEK